MQQAASCAVAQAAAASPEVNSLPPPREGLGRMPSGLRASVIHAARRGTQLLLWLVQGKPLAMEEQDFCVRTDCSQHREELLCPPQQQKNILAQILSHPDPCSWKWQPLLCRATLLVWFGMVQPILVGKVGSTLEVRVPFLLGAPRLS